MAARKRGFGNITNALQDVKYYLRDSHRMQEPLSAHAALAEVALGPEHAKGAAAFEGALRRHSAQVCDVHRRLKDIDIEEFAAMLTTPQLFPKGHRSSASIAGNGGSAGSIAAAATAAAINGGEMHRTHSAGDVSQAPPSDRSASAAPRASAAAAAAAQNHPAVNSRRHRLDKLYDAAVVADQNAKLSIFSTRPAIYSPFFNFLCEFMCTTALIYGALMIYERREQLYGPERSLFPAEGERDCCRCGGRFI